MPIQNIQGLVDKKGLSYISNFTREYYEEGLANLGQRNTNDSLLENVTFSANSIFTSEGLNIQNEPYLYVIYCNENPNDQTSIGKFYTLVKENNDENNEFEITIDYIQDKISRIQLESIDKLIENNIIVELQLSGINENNNEFVILNKQLNIISELFDFINNPKDEEGNTLLDENDNIIHPIRNNRMFIPINYQFGYIANGINKQIIYHNFKDVYVHVIPEGFADKEDDYEIESLSFYLNNIFYCAQQKFIKTSVYEYAFTSDEEIIYSKKFTLPYVNKDDCWVINDQETSIKAKVDDVKNLNIILAYYYKNGNEAKYRYLSGIDSDTFNVNRIGVQESTDATTFNIKNGSDVILCAIQTPIIKGIDLKLTKDDVKINKILANSTLVIISKISDIAINGDNLNRFGNGYVTTMWHYQNDKFKCICIDDNIALDFNQLTNFDNLLKYEIQNIKQIEPDNFLYTHLVFDQIYQQIKQENNKPIYSYPVLQNIKGSEYNNKYANNMNFSLKYVNYISGDVDNNIISGVSKRSDIKYLKNNTGTSANTVTNTLYQYTINNKINYYNEYIPNYNVPIFDFSEILVKDSNVLNKQNIITFDYNGTMYYSYIGTTHDTSKDILTIGSSNININLGENTLTDYNVKKSFVKQNTLNIDFNTINANGKLNINDDLEVGGNIKLNKLEWNVSTINNIEIQSTSFIPQFKYYNFYNSLTKTNNIYKILNINSLENDVKNISNDANTLGLRYGSEEAKKYLFICPIIAVPHSAENNMPYYYKYNDLLILPNLVKYLGLDSNVVTNFESNTNDIIEISGKKTYLVSSNSILSESISIISATDTGLNINLLNVKEFYLGNTLYVTYIPAQKKLIVNEIQTNKIKSIWKIPTKIN